MLAEYRLHGALPATVSSSGKVSVALALKGCQLISTNVHSRAAAP